MDVSTASAMLPFRVCCSGSFMLAPESGETCPPETSPHKVTAGCFPTCDGQVLLSQGTQCSEHQPRKSSGVPVANAWTLRPSDGTGEAQDGACSIGTAHLISQSAPQRLDPRALLFLPSAWIHLGNCSGSEAPWLEDSRLRGPGD